MKHLITISLLGLILISGSCSNNSAPSPQDKVIQNKLSTEDFMDAVRISNEKIEKIIIKEKNLKSMLTKILEIQKESKLPLLDFRKVMIKTMRKLNIPNDEQKFMVNSFDSSIRE